MSDRVFYIGLELKMIARPRRSHDRRFASASPQSPRPDQRVSHGVRSGRRHVCVVVFSHCLTVHLLQEPLATPSTRVSLSQPIAHVRSAAFIRLTTDFSLSDRLVDAIAMTLVPSRAAARPFQIGK
jgi:hypothetical protein